MSLLLDSCVVSEGIKELRDAKLAWWVKMTTEDGNILSAITFGELKFGIDRLAEGSKRKRLEEWLLELISGTPPQRILAVDRDVALGLPANRPSECETGRRTDRGDRARPQSDPRDLECARLRVPRACGLQSVVKVKHS
jgi:hypothetical protein